MNDRLRPMMTSNQGSYLTPPSFLGRLHRWWGHDFFDPYSNGASQVGARWTCARDRGEDGNAVDWGRFKKAFCNPEYGRALEIHMAAMHRYGRELRVCEIVGLVPCRGDTQWRKLYVTMSADAWVEIEGRLTFWLPIPIRRPTNAVDDGKKPTPYLQRRWPWASEDNLPPGFRPLYKDGKQVPGWAVGPELDQKLNPAPAPFPSLVPYWGDDVKGFATHFGSLGTLVVPRDPPLPKFPSVEALAMCPQEVLDWIAAARERKAGVYPRKLVAAEPAELAEPTIEAS